MVSDLEFRFIKARSRIAQAYPHRYPNKDSKPMDKLIESTQCRMSPFLTIGEAASTLAGSGAAREDIEMWIAVLVGQADALRVVQSVTSYGDSLPGGISYSLSHRPEEWRIPRFVLNAWCAANGLMQFVTKEAHGQPTQSVSEPNKILTHKLKHRVRELASEIDRAKTQATSPDDYHAVWVALREMALSEAASFSGMIDETKGLEYTRANGKKEYFSKDALRKRMIRTAR